MPADEQSLIRRSQHGDEAAFRQIIERFQPRTYRLLYRLLGDREDALDGCQEVFWRAWQSLGRFEPGKPLQPWLDRIATNYAYDRLRQRRRSPPLASDDSLLDSVPDSGDGPETRLMHGEEKAAVALAVQRLPPEYRLVIVLRHERGLSYQDICAELGWPLSLVKNRLMRARRLLRDELAPLIDEGRQRHALST